MTLEVRDATPSDVPRILHLVRELARYEREPDAVIATEEDFLRDGFGPSPAFRVKLVGAAGAEPIGFALYCFSYSTWLGRRCLYLEDLFVEPAHRGAGAGMMLMRELAREAVATGCRRFLWQVLDWNEAAIAFYERLGGKIHAEWQTVRLEGAALARLAEATPS
jgi:GNAT superfamily N-acetyltransferase